MKTTTKITDIDFDGAKIASVKRNGSNLVITLKTQNKINSFEVVFHSVTDEKSELFKSKGESIINTHFPPLDVIETFEENNGIYKFSGYCNNQPWAVWEFKASNYVFS